MSGKHDKPAGAAGKPQPPRDSVRRRRPGATLFKTEAQPLDPSVLPIAVVRPSRWRNTLPAVALIAVLAGSANYAQETNALVHPDDTNAVVEPAAATTNEVATAAEGEPDLIATNEPAVLHEVMEQVDISSAETVPAPHLQTPVPEPVPAAAPVAPVATPTTPARQQQPPQQDRKVASQPAANPGPQRDRGTGQTTSRSAALDLAAFRIIAERNIFDPTRGPRRSQTEQRSRPARKVQSLSLVGLMSYEKGTFAFFDGTDSSFRKAAKAGDKVAGFEIVSVSPNTTRLKSGEKEFSLQVGSQLRREDEGDWTQSVRSDAYVSNSTVSPPASTPGSTGAAQSTSAPTGAENDVLRRLMQRREQE